MFSCVSVNNICKTYLTNRLKFFEHFKMGTCSSVENVPTKHEVMASFVDAQLKLDRIGRQLERGRNIVEQPPPRGFENLEHTMLIPVSVKLKLIHKELDKALNVSSTL